MDEYQIEALVGKLDQESTFDLAKVALLNLPDDQLVQAIREVCLECDGDIVGEIVANIEELSS